MEVRLHLEKLKAFVEKEGFLGYDPYDALNSPVLKNLAFNRKWLRIAFIQFLKKSPVNIRPILAIKKGYNPKGLGLFLWSYAKLYRVDRHPDSLERIDALMDQLETLRSPGYSGNCWGYNFDWQSRSFYLPKKTPTIVNTAFIGHALLDTYKFTGSSRALEMAVSIKDFILEDLHRSEEDGCFCFSYSPLDRTKVHNANYLGASLLIRLFKATGDEVLKETALKSLAYSLKYQHEDGSWYYAEADYQRWIDSFHTGFNLQGLLYFIEAGFSGPILQAFEKGKKFYAENFFSSDGAPKYYHDRLYPLDIHSATQGVVFFSMSPSGVEKGLEKLARWMIDNMQHRKGYFYFQKKKRHTIKIPYIRWSQAWAFHALTAYLIYQEGRYAHIGNS